MLGWEELSQQLQRIIHGAVRFARARRREEVTIGLAAILFWLGYSFAKWLTPEIKDWVNSWHGLLIIPGLFYVVGLILLSYGFYRIWLIVHTPDLPPPRDRPSAIKGPIAFTPADGELFRRLGREDELGKLLGFIEDDQVRLVVVMGASGVGKSSLLRAGLTNILKSKGIDYHYWEAVPTSPGQRLLRAIQESWQSGPASDANGAAAKAASFVKPESLEDLVNPSVTLGERRHVIVLDQFEQLRGSSANSSVFRLLRKIAREAKPPHRVTWIVAFRREFRAAWEDFTLPEKERGIYPAEISLRLFTIEQARDVISQLVAEAKLSIQQKVVDNLIAAATVDGEVSPVDIGIGLLVLAELHDRQGGQTVTLEDYQFAGGAEGLLTQYLNRCLDIFSEADRQTIINAMLALRRPGTHQRIAEGRTCAELAEETRAEPGRLETQLDRLAQRDMRLLETLSTTNESAVLYRLPHERLIPALHRVAGQLLAEVDQVRLKLENAFTAWKNSNQGAQYLLKAGELRAVQRYKLQIPWGKDEAAKRTFLRRSQRRRVLRRSASAAILIVLMAVGWLANSQYRRYDARTYLKDNNYPPELYDWHPQLKTLALNTPMNVQRFPLLPSNILEDFTISVQDGTHSLDGLVANLANCRALRKLNLNISKSQVSDLTPLSKLTALTHLTLDLSHSQVDDLKPLSSLTALTQLKLKLAHDRFQRGSLVTDLTPLTELTAVTQLDLDISGHDNLDVTPLRRMTNVTKLTLGGVEIHKLINAIPDENLTQLTLNNVGTLKDLPSMFNLRQLTVDLNESQESDLTPLARLGDLNQLELDLSRSQVHDLGPLARLGALSRLTLNLDGTQVSDLTPLMKLSGLTQLFIAVGDGHVRDLTPLTTLTALTHLGISGGDVSDLGPLTTLHRLEELTLNLGGTSVSDLTPLANLLALRTLVLDIRYSDLRDLTPLTRLPALTQLVLDISFSELEDLIVLTKLPALTLLGLNIYARRVDDLTPLTKLPALTYLVLDIRGTNVSDLTPLTALTALRGIGLILDDSQVKDLVPLTKLTKLTNLSLGLTRSQVSDLTPLTKLNSLTYLKIDLVRSQVSDLAPLAGLNSCQTLVLSVNTNQRMSLKAIPPNVTNLDF